jgi:hypothetical protein
MGKIMLEKKELRESLPSIHTSVFLEGDISGIQKRLKDQLKIIKEQYPNIPWSSYIRIEIKSDFDWDGDEHFSFYGIRMESNEEHKSRLERSKKARITAEKRRKNIKHAQRANDIKRLKELKKRYPNE